MAVTRCLCSLFVFLICWASYAPQSFADVVIKTPTLLRISTIFIPVRNSTLVILTKRCITAPLHLQQVSWSKNGYTCHSPPDLHRDINITIYMDISLNPGPERCQRGGLRALYLNARSLKAYVASDDSHTRRICKITILQELIYSGDFDVVGICETWLNESVIDSEIIPGYSIFRRDREDLGGGVIVAVKGNIQASRRLDLEREDVELVAVELKRCHEKSVLLYCFYHPNTSPDPIFKLNSSLCDNSESACIIVLGDFNLPELHWSVDQTAPIDNGSRADHNIFCDLMGDNFLQQFIPGPTHLAGNKLDLLLCNWPEVIGSVRSFHPRDGLFPSDHYVVEFEIILKFKRAKTVTRQFYDFKNGNFDSLRDSLTRLPFEVAAWPT